MEKEPTERRSLSALCGGKAAIVAGLLMLRVTFIWLLRRIQRRDN